MFSDVSVLKQIQMISMSYARAIPSFLGLLLSLTTRETAEVMKRRGVKGCFKQFSSPKGQRLQHVYGLVLTVTWGLNINPSPKLCFPKYRKEISCVIMNEWYPKA